MKIKQMKIGRMLKKYMAAILCLGLLLNMNLLELKAASDDQIENLYEEGEEKKVTVNFFRTELEEIIPVATPADYTFDNDGNACVRRPQLYEEYEGYYIDEAYTISKEETKEIRKIPFYFVGDSHIDAPTPITKEMAYEDVFDIFVELKLTDYPIHCYLNGGQYPQGKSNPSGYTVRTETFTLIEPVREGYTFLGWTYQGQATPVKNVTITQGSTGERSFGANWQKLIGVPYTVIHKTQNVEGTGYETAETEVLAAGALDQVTPAVKNYSGFTAPAPRTVTVQADGSTVVEYLYERNTCQITYDMNGHGQQIEPASAKYEAQVSAPADPTAEGYTFDGWYTDKACTDSCRYTFTTMPLGGIYLYAKWTKVKPAGSVSLPAGNGWYQGSIPKSEITSIHITKDITKAPAVYTESWDASAAKDGGVEVYVETGGKLTMVTDGISITVPENAHNCFREFTNATAITGLEILDTSKVTDFSCMFAKDEKLTSLDLSSWDLSEAETLGYMFYGDSALTGVSFPQKKTGAAKGKLKSLRSLFYGCSSLKDENIIALDTSGVTDMRNLFYGCASLKEVDFYDLDIGRVTDMAGMCCGCSSMEYFHMGTITSSVQDMSYMFAGTSMLDSVDLQEGGANLSAVINMSCMFLNSGAKEISLSSNCVYSAVTDTSFMFYGCSKLIKINSAGNLADGPITKDTNMFAKCVNLKGTKGTTYTDKHAGKQYARVDTDMRTGYFSQDFYD